MKKFLAMLLALVMALSLVACGEKKDDTQGNGDGDATAAKVKVGFITLHDENSTYDKNFIDAAKEACANLGLVENEDYFIKTNVGETEQCAEVAADLVDAGCNIIFADSFGHEPYMIEVAKANPEVQFCHSTGTRAHTEGLANYHNAFASIYEGRYLAGIAAGLKLNAMIDAGDIKADEAKMGYVGAFTYAEVVSGYTSFYLGAKSVCPTVTMDVTFTGSWYDETLEKEGAEKLIQGGCKLISLRPARTPVFPTFPTTAPLRLPAPTPTSSPPASTGRPTMSMPSRLSWTAPPSMLTGPALWPPTLWS